MEVFSPFLLLGLPFKIQLTKLVHQSLRFLRWSLLNKGKMHDTILVYTEVDIQRRPFNISRKVKKNRKSLKCVKKGNS